MTTRLPAGACNAHCHVFGPRARFPYAQGAPFVPAIDAPKEELFALNDGLGLQRCVVVQSTCHGFDNSATEDAVGSRPDSYRGIALLPTDVSDNELRRLDAAGFRGVRFNFMGHLGQQTATEDVLSLAKRFEPWGWHLQIHADPALLADLVPALQHAPTPVIVDHIGRIDASLGPDQPHFKALMRFLSGSRHWVKLSGMDRISLQGPPYADAQELAKTLIAEFGDRVLWGNDWPHPNHAGPVPDEQQLVDLIGEIAPTESARNALMVHNPQRLYRFGAGA